MANGSDIDHDILVEIAKLLTDFDDFFAFSLVCHSWRLAAAEESSRFNYPIKIPWLMYTTKATRNRRVFLDLSIGKTRPTMLPEIIFNGNTCFSSKGWLITIAPDTTMRLFHPFALAEIKLPHIKTIKNWKNYEIDTMYPNFIKKCVLSSCPLSASHSTLMVIYGERRQLAHTNAGDKSWNSVKTWQHAGFFDVIYCKDNFYAVNSLGEVIVLRGDNPSVAQKVAVRPCNCKQLVEKKGDNLYMVESAESLLVIRRRGSYNRGTYKASGFQVFEVDLSNNRWMEVKSLGDKALFLGCNSSICVRGGLNTLSNCIYFTDDCLVNEINWLREEGKDMGIYHMDDGRIEAHSQGDLYDCVNPPMWIQLCF